MVFGAKLTRISFATSNFGEHLKVGIATTSFISGPIPGQTYQHPGFAGNRKTFSIKQWTFSDPKYFEAACSSQK